MQIEEVDFSTSTVWFDNGFGIYTDPDHVVDSDGFPVEPCNYAAYGLTHDEVREMAAKAHEALDQAL